MFSRTARTTLSRTAARSLATEATPSTSTLPSEPIPSTSSASAPHDAITPPTPPSETTPRPRDAATKKSSRKSVFEYQPPRPIKKGVHVATLQFRSYTPSLDSLTFFASFALRAARALNLPTSNIISLPTATTLWTTPRGPFAHKKSQENFWRKEHKRAIKVYDGNEEIVDAWLAFLRKEALGGVGMKAQVFTYRELGWGQKMVSEEGFRMSAVDGGEAEFRMSAVDGGEAELPPTEGDVQAAVKIVQAELEADIKADEAEASEPAAEEKSAAKDL